MIAHDLHAGAALDKPDLCLTMSVLSEQVAVPSQEQPLRTVIARTS